MLPASRTRLSVAPQRGASIPANGRRRRRMVEADAGRIDVDDDDLRGAPAHAPAHTNDGRDGERRQSNDVDKYMCSCASPLYRSSSTRPRNAAPSSSVKTHLVSHVPSSFGRARRTPPNPPSRSTRSRRLTPANDVGSVSVGFLTERRQVRDDFVDFLLRGHPGLPGVLVDDECARRLVALAFRGLRGRRLCDGGQRSAGREDNNRQREADEHAETDRPTCSRYPAWRVQSRTFRCEKTGPGWGGRYRVTTTESSTSERIRAVFRPDVVVTGRRLAAGIYGAMAPMRSTERVSSRPVYTAVTWRLACVSSPAPRSYLCAAPGGGGTGSNRIRNRDGDRQGRERGGTAGRHRHDDAARDESARRPSSPTSRDASRRGRCRSGPIASTPLERVQVVGRAPASR